MITIEHTGGIGGNAYYTVRQDGKSVALLSRNGRSGWRVSSRHYGHPLGYVGKTIDEAKLRVAALHYPDEREVYETIAQNIERLRREYKEKLHAQEMAALVRAMIAGSNSAREQLEQLVAATEAWIVDRSDTREKRQVAADLHFEQTGTRVYVASGVPLYPEPPGEKS